MAQKKQESIEKKESGVSRLGDPFRALEQMRREMESLWDRAWPAFPGPSFGPLSQLFKESKLWSPAVDIFEEKGELVVKADLPGMSKKDIEVSLEDGNLVIQGEHKQETEVKEEDFYRLERSRGRVFRRIALPFEVAAAKINASFKDGILEVRIPRTTAARPKAKKVRIT